MERLQLWEELKIGWWREEPREGLGGLNQRKVSARTLWGPQLGKNEMDRNHKFIFSDQQAVGADVLTLNTKEAVQFSSVAQSCPTLCDPMNRSTPGLPVHHQLPEFTQTHVHRVSDAIQPSHPLSSPSTPAPSPSQHQSLLQWVNSSHEVAKVLEFQP